jgi:hypothetical protein
MSTDLLHCNAVNKGAEKIGTLHDIRSTTYDSDWVPYFNGFATENPDILNLQCCEIEGWRARGSKINAVITNHQIQARFCPYMVPPNRSEAAAS